MAKTTQTYANHARYVPGFHLVLGLLLVLNFFHCTKEAWAHFDTGTVWSLVVSIALMIMYWYVRAFPVAVQDRVIRLELRLRLRELAPDVMPRFDELTVAQVTALRFASDHELPALARGVLEGKLTQSAEIKKSIKDWQGDFWRA